MIASATNPASLRVRLQGVIRSWLVAATFILLVASCPAPSLAVDENDSEAEVASAINSLRGVNWAALGSEDGDNFRKRHRQAWKTLEDNSKIAVPAIRKTLQTERSDSFLIIDLSVFLLLAEPKSTEEVAGYFIHADVNANPGVAFHVMSIMAARHCTRCLPAVRHVLKLRELDAYIQQHALRVPLFLGIIFTLAQYGDDAIPTAIEGLSSTECPERANAALALGILQPTAPPASIRKLALNDACSRARAAAWTTLGVLDEPDLPRLAAERLVATSPPDKEERLGLVAGLGSSFRWEAPRVLEALHGDPDADVRAAAKKELEGHKQLETLRNALKEDSAGAAQRDQLTVRAELARAVEKGRWEPKGHLFDRAFLLKALSPADITLLNRARAAVLSRLSDECLYEYFELTYVVQALRYFKADVTRRGSALD